MNKRIELMPGDRYAAWTVVAELMPIGETRTRRRVVNCRCQCGAEKAVLLSSLRTGSSQSCGCAQREAARSVGIANGTHGMKGTPTYNAWSGMKARCENPANRKFVDYGSRGIKVCERWRNSFENFLGDMGECPKGCSIDRIDTNGHYEPSNCRWATQTVQQRNRRNNIVITFGGESCCLSEWAERLGIPYKTLHGRISRGVNVKDAFTTGSQS